MVRAILAGRKTQTRRAVNPQPDCATLSLASSTSNRDVRVIAMRDGMFSIFCPYGQPGDRLWVKETFTMAAGDCLYRATDTDDPLISKSTKWKPSIFMPRKSSRITLEIAAVRVERLQDITEEDAIAEGIHAFNAAQITYYHYSPTAAREEHFRTAVDAYRALWNSINGPESWAQNPWVWVLTFKRIAP